MESIGVVGISIRGHDTAALARFTIAKEERGRRLPELAAAIGVEELIYLATCNRVEVAYRAAGHPNGHDHRGRIFACLAGREPQPGEAERTLRGWIGEGAVEHLFLVAAGLDSAQLGEREIQGQLREALTIARRAGTAGVLLDRLVEEALRVAHQVHRQTQLGAGKASLAELAADFLLERVRQTPSPVALIGVSPMTRRCAEALLREQVPVVLVNRSVERAEALAAELGVVPVVLGAAAASSAGDVPPVATGTELPPVAAGAVTCMSLDAFRQRPPQVEALLAATGAPEPVLDRAALERLAARTPSHQPPLVVDLAVPPDVDPEVACAAHVPRIGMDDLNAAAQEQRRQRLAEAAAARELVDAALHDLRKRLAERVLAPVIAKLNQRYRQTALEGVERLLGKEGLNLEAKEREAIERWAETLARRFAHLPTLGLRGLATEQGMLAVKSFLAACDASLFEEFCQIAGQLEFLAEPQEKGVDG